MPDDFDAAISLALDATSRRKYLTEASINLPGHGSARDVIRAAMLEVVRDLAAMQIAGIPEKDPGRWREAQFRAAQVRAMNDELLEHDRLHNSGAQGKALLANHLRDGTPFIFMLRSFELEVREIADPIDAHLGWRVLPGEHAFKSLANSLSTLCATLLIVNSEDPLPPEKAAKLFAPANGWRNLVFCLIAEASVVLAAAPYDRDSLTSGVAQELQAVVALGAKDRTIIILEPSVHSPIEGASERIGPSAILRTNLLKQEFPHIFESSDVEDNAHAIVRAVRAILEDRTK